MLRNYLKIAWRAFWKNSTVSIVNVLGLAVGLVVTLLIVLYVAHEYSYDRFHTKGRQIVQVEFKHTDADRSYTHSTMSYRFGDVVKSTCPGIDEYARITEKGFGSKLVQSDVHHANFEPNVRFADAGFLRLFSFPLVQGDPATALTHPFTVLLTESTARRYFGNQNPLGKTITYDKKTPLQVVGVLKDLPGNSSIQFDFLVDLFTQRSLEKATFRSMMDEKMANQWIENVGTGGSYETYFLLSRNADKAAIEAKIPSLLSESEKIRDIKDVYALNPLFDLHFSIYSPKSQQRVVIFSIIAGLILALALINYVNLTTARSTVRAKEVGVRKVIGAARKALIYQFYFESILYVTLAFGIAFLTFQLIQPVFYETLHLRIDQSFLASPFFLIPAAVFFLISVLLSGSYPALLLSRFAPVQVMKGRFSAAGSAGWVRKGLTIFQFTVSIALIIGALFIKKQLDFILNKDLGINRDRVATVFLDSEDGLDKHYKAIREEIRQLKGVESVTASSLLVYSNYMNSWEIKRLNSDRKVSINTYPVDEEFIKTLNVQWAIAPRKPAGLTTKNQIVINEAAARQLGINARNYEQTLDLGQGTTKELVGVVKDFNYTSLAQSIRPMALFIGPDTTFRNYLYVKIARGASTADVLADVQHVYNRYKTAKPFDYTFLDETYRRLYESEQGMSQIIMAFTGLAILIACLGLFGLATFTAEQRTKEIGIRKILGASALGIVRMLSGDFLKPVLISMVIASPIAWYFTNRWLADFAYKIDSSWWIFALAGILALTIALATVSFQSIKVALMNPVKSLRSE